MDSAHCTHLMFVIRCHKDYFDALNTSASMLTQFYLRYICFHTTDNRFFSFKQRWGTRRDEKSSELLLYHECVSSENWVDTLYRAQVQMTQWKIVNLLYVWWKACWVPCEAKHRENIVWKGCVQNCSCDDTFIANTQYHVETLRMKLGITRDLVVPIERSPIKGDNHRGTDTADAFQIKILIHE